MRWYFKVLVMVALAVFLLLFSQAASSQWPVDEEFNIYDWVMSGVELTDSVTFAAGQEQSGGYPDAFRSVNHSLPYPLVTKFSRATTAHIYAGYSYSPFESGPVKRMDFRSDFRNLTPASVPPVLDVVLQQNGQMFRTNSNVPRRAEDWSPAVHISLRSRGFWALDRSCDQPDFSSSGGFLEFGFSLSTACSIRNWPAAAGESISTQAGIDNWAIVLDPGSAPVDPLNRAPVAVNDRFVIDGYSGRMWLEPIANDYDPDGDELYIPSVSPPSYGTAGPDSEDFILYQHLGESTQDEFCYVLSDFDIHRDVMGRVEVLMDCACTLACLDFGGISPKADSLDLSLIYQVRDEMFDEGIAGRRFIDYYYNYSNKELAWLLAVDEPTLGAEGVAVAELWSPLLDDFLNGAGDMLVTQQQVDDLDTFLGNLYASASIELRRVITDELDNLGDLQNYVGMTSRQAFIQALVIDGIFHDGFEDPPPATKRRRFSS